MTDARMIITGPIAGHRLIQLMEQLETVSEGEVTVIGRAGGLEIAMVDLEITPPHEAPPPDQPPTAPAEPPQEPLVRRPARHSDTRAQILDDLKANGPVVDPEGKATRILMDRAGIDLAMTSLTTLLKSMEGKGQIVREMRAKSTLRIALPDDDRGVRIQPGSMQQVTRPDPEPASDEPSERETVQERRQRIRDAAAAAVG